MKIRYWLGVIGVVVGIIGSQGTSNGGVVSIDITSAGSPAQDISGQNAGLNYGDSALVVENFVGDARLDIYRRSSRISFDPVNGSNDSFRLATLDGSKASIFRFAKNEVIGSDFAGEWDTDRDDVAFYTDDAGGHNALNFGPDSFIGFRFGTASSYRYGYIEVLWNWTGAPETSTFEILSAAYEDQLNTPILAGAQPGSEVPEPTSMAIFGLGALGMAYRARRKNRR